MEPLSINWLALIVAVVAKQAIGALWFSPLLFARPWSRATGIRYADMQAGLAKALIPDVIAVGFNARENAPLRGEIRVVSADRVTDPRTGRSYFKAEIALLADRQDGTLLSRLSPGMPVEVVVPVAPRTAFDYLVAPLRESMRGAWREL